MGVLTQVLGDRLGPTGYGVFNRRRNDHLFRHVDDGTRASCLLQKR